MTRLTLAALVFLAGCAAHPAQWSGGPRPVATPMLVESFVVPAWVDCEIQARAQGRDIVGECMRARGFVPR